MDQCSTTPPSLKSSNPNNNSSTKSASRLSKIDCQDPSSPPLSRNLSLDLITSLSPKLSQFSPSPRSHHHRSPVTRSVQIKDLLLLSPSPRPRSLARLSDMAVEEQPIEPSKRRCRNRGNQMSLMSNCGGGSPRNNRRTRRRVEIEPRDDREMTLAEEIGKIRKRRHSGKSKKEKLSLVPFVAPAISRVEDVGGEDSLDRIAQMISDMVMWNDVAKSSLWFGFGCLCFLSSCFANGINFSIFSAISQLSLLFLGASFLSNSVCQRNNAETNRQFKLKEEDIVKVGRLILPAMNLAISKTRVLFSGEPSMTLKVVPFLLLGAEYGHLITMRRLFALGFFVSFTIPKLYSSYSSQINQKAENIKRGLLDTWGACSRKKFVAASAITAFWNLSSVKTRIFTAFIALVILRYCRQHIVTKAEETEEVKAENEEKGEILKDDQTAMLHIWRKLQNIWRKLQNKWKRLMPLSFLHIDPLMSMEIFGWRSTLPDTGTFRRVIFIVQTSEDSSKRYSNANVRKVGELAVHHLTQQLEK
ncbi:hypothetical protein ACFE04_017449 [Oxalis oulophora]